MVIVRRINAIPARDEILFRQSMWERVTDGTERTARQFARVRIRCPSLFYRWPPADVYVLCLPQTWDLLCRVVVKLKVPYGYDTIGGILDVRDARLLEQGRTVEMLAKRWKGSIIRNSPTYILSIHHDKDTGYVLVKVS